MERMLSVVATCRQQNRNVLDFLTAYCGAPREGSTPPSLLPQRALAVRAAEEPPLELSRIWEFLEGVNFGLRT